MYGGCGFFFFNLWIVGDEFIFRNLVVWVLWVLCKFIVGLWYIVKSSVFEIYINDKLNKRSVIGIFNNDILNKYFVFEIYVNSIVLIEGYW